MMQITTERLRQIIKEELQKANLNEQMDPTEKSCRYYTREGGHPEEEWGDPADIYQLQPGDTLWDLAEWWYGSGEFVEDIQEANPLMPDDPKTIQAGCWIARPPWVEDLGRPREKYELEEDLFHEG